MVQKKEITVAVSGGFDPIHVGHIRLFKEAKKLGSRLVVILNNDNWLIKKKGYVFMPEKERAEIIKGLKSVDEVVLTEHPENADYRHIGFTLRKVKPDIFVNGGDKGITNEFEVAACEEMGCKMVAGVGGGKVQSSSWLIDSFFKNYRDKLDK
ncbi:adenylyltransferase/cytidyltransferase family protein [Patescibacteria group bacterium]|nr:adenylyltransferase/cytidyltransferase family protein [Patescibacteria group bacterium]